MAVTSNNDQFKEAQASKVTKGRRTSSRDLATGQEIYYNDPVAPTPERMSTQENRWDDGRQEVIKQPARESDPTYRKQVADKKKKGNEQDVMPGPTVDGFSPWDLIDDNGYGRREDYRDDGTTGPGTSFREPPVPSQPPTSNVPPPPSTPDGTSGNANTDSNTDDASSDPTGARQRIQQMINDPTGFLTDNDLNQQYTPLTMGAGEIQDPNKYALDALDAGVAQTVDNTQGPEANAVDVNTAAATQATAQQGTAQQGTAQQATSRDTDVSQGQAFEAGFATQGETAATPQVMEFEAALIDPASLTKSLDEVEKLAPMKAASMAENLDGLLEGMENGNVPVWARPAVAKVEQMLASRGISASSVGRDSLFNAIIQSAMPIAQQDATFQQDSYKTTYNSKVQAIMSDTNMEFAAKQFNANSVNQTNQMRAQLKMQADMQAAARADAMSQFNAEQKNANAQFNARLRTDVSLQNARMLNEGSLQDARLATSTSAENARLATQVSLENARMGTQTSLENARMGTQVDMQNAQSETQVALENARMANQTDQFNESTRLQAAQFLSQMLSQENQFNASQANAMTKVNMELKNQREQFNSQVASQIEQSNVNWRRQINQANTAGVNAVNQANVQNAFNLSNQALTFLWQELRDEAHWDFQASQADRDRKAQLEAQILANETAMGGEVGKLVERIMSGSNFLTDFLSDIWD